MEISQNFVVFSEYMYFNFWLYVCTVLKSKVKISLNFMAFSEYMNFKYILYIRFAVNKASAHFLSMNQNAQRISYVFGSALSPAHEFLQE